MINIRWAMVESEVIMKHKIINHAMFLILIVCSAIPLVWAGAEAKTTIEQPEFKPLNVNGQIAVPVLTTKLGFKSQGRWFPGQVVNLDLFAYNLQDARKFRMDLKYNPKQLRLVYVSRGTFLVEDQGLAEWNSGVIDNQMGLAANISGIRSQSFSGKETTLMRLNFIVTDVGHGQILLENPKIVSSNGIERVFDYTPLQFQVEQEK